MPYMNTIRFMNATIKKNVSNVQVESCDLKTEKGLIFKTDIYRPKQQTRGTVLFLHGMNHHGYRDDRVIHFCRALASCGYLAIAPHYSVIADFLLDDCSVEEFAETIKVVAHQYSFNHSKKIGVFSASFSGALCLRAILRSDITPLISSFCAVGICYHPRITFENILAAHTEDYYAKLISVKNLLKSQGELDSDLEQGFNHAILDVYEKAYWPRFDAYLLGLDKKKSQTLQEWRHRIVSNENMTPYLQKHIDYLDAHLSKFGDLSCLKNRMVLIHSAHDEVTPMIESELLYKELRGKGVAAKLLITPLLQHTTFQFRPKYFLELVRLLKAFDNFFQYV